MEFESNQPTSLETAVSPPVQPRQPFHFQNQFQGTMTMHSDLETVKTYLDSHQGWFVRCAKPMQAEPIGNNSYALKIGRFGALGFEVEPKFGVELLPESEGIYRMETVPLQTSDIEFYNVNYQAELQLIEQPTANLSQVSFPTTGVEWVLNLGVTIHFPRFIYRFPQSMIQKTGDQLLAQIVRKVSHRLTHKVQVDFHTRYDLPLPS